MNFTAYGAEYSGPYNMGLNKLYEKYKSKGLEIYQVSLDSDEHFWKVAASNLPWVTVRDKNSIYSTYARSYNVTELPTSFLLGKDGAILQRITDNNALEEALKKAL